MCDQAIDIEGHIGFQRRAAAPGAGGIAQLQALIEVLRTGQLCGQRQQHRADARSTPGMASEQTGFAGQSVGRGHRRLLGGQSARLQCHLNRRSGHRDDPNLRCP